MQAEAMVWLAEQLEAQLRSGCLAARALASASQVRARQRIEVSLEGNQPILLTACGLQVRVREPRPRPGPRKATARLPTTSTSGGMASRLT